MSNEPKNRRWILVSRPKPGPLQRSDFCFEEQHLSPLQDGEILVKNTLLSFDPSQRVWLERDSYVPKIPLGEVIRALSVGVVEQSRHESFAPGTRLLGMFGWQDYAVCDPNDHQTVFMQVPSGLDDSAALSVFGLTGLTAYFGMIDIGNPQASDVVVVSGASGATGSIAAQVAKNCGARVIGIAGGAKKCAWLTETAKLHHAIDYKNENVAEALRLLAPHGVNVYFDNVGGPVLDSVLANLAHRARIIMCGAISHYQGDSSFGLANYANIIVKRARMEGFIITDYAHRYAEGIAALSSMLAENNLVFEIDVQHGLEHAPETLQRLFDGKNLGKQLLQL